MIKAIIIEDEAGSRDSLRRMLEKHCPEVEICAEAEGYRPGLKAIEEHQPDAIFLDIEMPDGSGFRLLENCREINFEVIFTTAFDQFALKAIKYAALDYLLKPISADELVEAVKKIKIKLETKESGKQMDVLLNNIHEAQEDQKIVLHTSTQTIVKKVMDIIRCESDNYYTIYHFREGEQLLISKTLKETEQFLGDEVFLRIHKSHLVNIQHIKSFDGGTPAYITLSDNSQIPVSRRKKETVREVMANL